MKYIVAIVFLVILSGCANLPGGTNTGGVQEDHGDGLRIYFSINDEFIPSLRYSLALENRGAESIEISREDFSLSTTQQTLDGQIPLEQEDIDALKDDMFSNGPLQIPPNQRYEQTGILTIKEDFFSRSTTDSLRLNIGVDYSYSSQLTTNVALDLQSYSLSTNRLEMSGPIQVRNMDALFDSRDSFSVVYTLQDRNRLASSVTIDDVQITFGSQQPQCSYYTEENSVRVPSEELSFSQSTRNQYIVCDIEQQFEQDEITSTTSSVELTYTYPARITNEISFP